MIAATSWPPNAGFHATRRPSSPTSRSTASPVSPAPSRAAARAATSRPHAVLGARTAHGACSSAHVGDARRDVLLDDRAASGERDRDGRRPTTRGSRGSGQRGAERDRRAADRARRASPQRPSSSWVTCARSGSTTTATTVAAAPDPLPGSATSGRCRRRSRGRARRRARRVRRAARPPRAPARRPGRRARAGRARPRAGAPGRPTSGSPSWPHGPGPRSAARAASGCGRAGTAARPVGVDLARVDEPLRGRDDRRAGATSAWTKPSSCSQRTCSTPSRVEVEVAHAGREREVEQLGELGTDLAGVGVDRVAADEHEVERALDAVSAAASARAVAERVGAGERAVGDRARRPSSTSRSVAHAIASRSASSAGGGPSVNTVHVPAVLGRERDRLRHGARGSRRSSRGRGRHGGAGRRARAPSPRTPGSA